MMDTQKTTVSQELHNLLKRKKEKNEKYSLRALARDIGISQPQLTRLIHGKRGVTPKEAYRIGMHLELRGDALIDFMKPSLEN